MSNIVSFFSGLVVGAYIAQNYEIINIKKTSNQLLTYLKSLEKDDDNKNK